MKKRGGNIPKKAAGANLPRQRHRRETRANKNEEGGREEPKGVVAWTLGTSVLEVEESGGRTSVLIPLQKKEVQTRE